VVYELNCSSKLLSETIDELIQARDDLQKINSSNGESKKILELGAEV